jgi:spermidine dehydrogenase
MQESAMPPARPRFASSAQPHTILRRDLLQGAAITVAATLAPELAHAAAADAELQNAPGYYPPQRTGMRGSHPGSFEAAHALRDGRLKTSDAIESGETFDLIVVGGGISGLAAAYFWRKAHPDAKVLVLDNHDDFGGHAKRNEVVIDGQTLLMNGGTLLIDSPRPYSAVAAGLMSELGVDPVALSKTCDRHDFYRQAGLRPATFFDAETFGADKLIVGLGGFEEDAPTPDGIAALLADAPLSPAARADIVRIETAKIDYLPGLTTEQKMDRLSRVSYRDFLLDIAKVDPGVIPYYQQRTHAEFGLGIDGEPALDCWGDGLPGFQGMGLDPQNTKRMGNTAAGYISTGGSPRFHFPDGNASIARLLVRKLVPAALPGSTAEDIVLAKCNYAALDQPESPVRLRLNSMAVHVRNSGPQEVSLDYVSGGKLYRVRAPQAVLACYNMMIPYLAPDLPEAQKAALHLGVKIPLVYTTVALRNWRAFARLGVSSVSAPGGYFSSFGLNPAETIGGYSTPGSPDGPMLVRMVRTPCLPGAPTERDQHRAGRAELLTTPFSTFEHHIRDQLSRTLKGGGFDADKDIAAIIVNRWPHGYAYEYNPLYDPWDIPPDQRPNVIGRQKFGRIAIANSDAGAQAYTDSAIDQAHRAVMELMG